MRRLAQRLGDVDPSGEGERQRMEGLELAPAPWLGKPDAARRYDSDYFTLVTAAPEEVTRRAQGVLVANLGKIQGGLPILPDAVPDDGQFDIAVLKTRTLGDWVGVAARILGVAEKGTLKAIIADRVAETA